MTPTIIPKRHHWQSVETPPPLDTPVWLADAEGKIWLGGRADDADGWLWGRIYGGVWRSKEGRWVGEIETDDDYKPVRWSALPEPPLTEPHCPLTRVQVAQSLEELFARLRVPGLRGELRRYVDALLKRVDNPAKYIAEAVEDAQHDLALLARIAEVPETGCSRAEGTAPTVWCQHIQWKPSRSPGHSFWWFELENDSLKAVFPNGHCRDSVHVPHSWHRCPICGVPRP